MSFLGQLPKRDYGRCRFCGVRFEGWSEKYDHPKVCVSPPKSMLAWVVGEVRGSLVDFGSNAKRGIVAWPRRIKADIVGVWDFVSWLAHGIYGIRKMKKEDRYLLMPLMMVAWIVPIWLFDIFTLPTWVPLAYVLVFFGLMMWFTLTMIYKGTWRKEKGVEEA